MKNFYKLKAMLRIAGIIALVAVIGFSFVACGDGGGGGGGGRPNPNPGGNSALSGNISIYPEGPVTVGTELTAFYGGGETVSYQWKRGTTNVGTNADTYTPDQAGSYTVTVSASGYTSKTSAAVTVNDRTLSGVRVYIYPGELALVGEELTARYYGFETVSYQWKRGTTNVGTNADTYTPDQAGSYTVTVSAQGYASMTSDAVTVIEEQPSGTEEFTYTLNYSKTAYRVSKGTLTTGAVTIPSSLNNLPVTEIDSYAFRNCTGITSVTIPNSITTIGYSAFENCTGLTSITIPSSVTSIGSSAFSGCKNITSVTISSGVTTIGSSTFEGCTGLTSVTIPNSVTSIGYGAFNGCTSLTSITIPSSVTTINSMVFWGCSSLTSVTIPSSVTSIGMGAFYNCTGLTSVTIPNSVTEILSYAFNGCTGIINITIPAGVMWIGAEAFYNWTASQTINVQGKANQAAADAVWDANWRNRCNATINYNG
jgi:hypothetical protein